MDRASFVSINNIESSRFAIDHLVGLGHQHIGIITEAYSSAISYDATRTLLRTNPEITAIYCTDNVLSAGAFAAIQDSDLHCPQDLSLIGFDDHEWSTLVRPRLTVVEQPTEAIGVAAAEDLLDAIAEPTRAPVTRLLSAHLVVRDSTAPPR